MSEQMIIEYIITALPALLAVSTSVVSVLKTFKEFKALKAEVVNMKSIEEVKLLLKNVINENYQLKKTLNETMTKIDHIERKC